MLLTLVLKVLKEIFALKSVMNAFFFIPPFTMHPPFAVFASLTCSFQLLKQQYSCLQQSPVLSI